MLAAETPGRDDAGAAQAATRSAAEAAATACRAPRPCMTPIMPCIGDYAPPVPADHAPTALADRRWDVLVLTGGLGAGKTTVAVEVGALLEERGTPCSVIDLDQLCWTSPDPASGLGVADVLHASLAAVLPVHARAGVRRLVLPRLLLGEVDLEGLRDALGDADVLVVELVADPEVRAERLRSRDSGSTLAGHLDEVEALLPPQGLADAVVATDGRTPDDVAREVLRTWDAAAAGRA